MILALSLAIVQAATATTTITLPSDLPRPVEAAVTAYRDCLWERINGQDDGRRSGFSERRVLSGCAVLRRTKYREALAGLNRSGWSAPASRQRVQRRFAEADESVWTTIGHLRIRRAGKR